MWAGSRIMGFGSAPNVQHKQVFLLESSVCLVFSLALVMSRFLITALGLPRKMTKKRNTDLFRGDPIYPVISPNTGGGVPHWLARYVGSRPQPGGIILAFSHSHNTNAALNNKVS